MSRNAKSGEKGIGKSPDPGREGRAEGGPGAQQQEWPGTDEAMDPKADHGEESYRGSGRLEGRRPRTATEFGGLDIVVNNLAAHWEQDGLEDITDEQLEHTFQINILSVFRVTRAALEYLEKGSAIINTGSVVALRGSPTLQDYSATKGAIHVFTKSLAISVAGRGIRVNCVAPGPVWTPLIPATRREDEVETFGADTAWGRPAQPAELAPAYVFFASADSRFCTGEILAISGDDTTR